MQFLKGLFGRRRDNGPVYTMQPFMQFIIKQNKTVLILTLLIATSFFIVLRYLYPIASFYADSFTWVGAAKNNQPVSFRPIGYSKFIQLFKLFSTSDFALVAAQYFTNIIANLFLFFTCTYLFKFSKPFRRILFALLICNPLYLFSSNYIYADAFFCSLTVLWFTLLVWLMYTSSIRYMVLQLAVLGILFMLRYNAVVFPFIATLAILFCELSWIRKGIYICANFLLVAALIFFISQATKSYTGTKTFSAFSGWQMANNAMHVLRYKNPDTADIDNRQTKEIISYVQPFFDTTSYMPKDATAWYMWHPYSPLKKYMQVYAKNNQPYFRIWTALGSPYNKFGTTVILKYPEAYLAHFILPNTKAYFLPPLETYETYMEGRDTIAAVAAKYYHYKSNKTPPHHPVIYSVVFEPWKYLFPIVHVLFLGLACWFFIAKEYRRHHPIFTKGLLCFIILMLGNFLFVALLAPSVLRYHIFILTLAFPYTLYLLQRVSLSKRQGMEEEYR